MSRTKKRSLTDFESPGIVQDTLPLDSIASPLYNPRTYNGFIFLPTVKQVVLEDLLL